MFFENGAEKYPVFHWQQFLKKLYLLPPRIRLLLILQNEPQGSSKTCFPQLLFEKLVFKLPGLEIVELYNGKIFRINFHADYVSLRKRSYSLLGHFVLPSFLMYFSPKARSMIRGIKSSSMRNRWEKNTSMRRTLIKSSFFCYDVSTA